MQQLICVNKPVGITPLQTITAIKEHFPELKKEKITYAGRLDPLAHGVLLLLVGEAAKQKEEFLILPKTYKFTVLFGIETDTYDVLGYVKEKSFKQTNINVNIIVNSFVNSYIGQHLQSYPPYSSKTVKGKPLFFWARNNKLNEIIIPKKEIEIFDFTCESINKIDIQDLQMKIKTAIDSVAGDFRQKDILKRWNEIFTSDKNKHTKLKTATFRISCSSGTYVRQLVHKLGNEIGCGAIALDILRVSIGNYYLKDAITL